MRFCIVGLCDALLRALHVTREDEDMLIGLPDTMGEHYYDVGTVDGYRAAIDALRAGAPVHSAAAPL